MDAIDLLKKQHKKTKTALKRLSREADDGLRSQIADELAAHMVIEETIFYPAVARVKSDLVLESYEEHAVAQFELKRLLATDLDDERFEARTKALLELISAHVEEEEEELFPRVQKAFEDEDLVMLGKRMKQTFDELVERGHDAILPRQPAVVTGDRQSRRIATESMHAG